jgi:hypothetical protein
VIVHRVEIPIADGVAQVEAFFESPVEAREYMSVMAATDFRNRTMTRVNLSEALNTLNHYIKMEHSP